MTSFEVADDYLGIVEQELGRLGVVVYGLLGGILTLTAEDAFLLKMSAPPDALSLLK